MAIDIFLKSWVVSERFVRNTAGYRIGYGLDFQIFGLNVGKSGFSYTRAVRRRTAGWIYTRASRPTGSWWFGGSPSGSDSNFLRVVSSFPNRRLSDNMLNTPKIRVAPSCASSPGSTPVGTGLPIRRHSNVERRGSTINLSPPSVIYVYITHDIFECARSRAFHIYRSCARVAAGQRAHNANDYVSPASQWPSSETVHGQGVCLGERATTGPWTPDGKFSKAF